MFNKKSSRHSLALFVALALGSGALLAPSAAGAADVSGQNVEIDDAHAPSDNAIAPGGGPAFGTAAGFIKEEANSGNVTGNTLTFKNINYMKQLYGGLTFGTGNVTGNKVFVNPATGTFFSNTDGIFGGNANGGGNVEYNHAEFNGNQLNGDLVGGMTKGTGTGIVKGNTALLKGGNANNIYGGMAVGGANGDVIGNTATIEGGTITGAGKIYGGYTDGTGKVTGNTARVTGGTAKDVYGGRSQSGDAEGNTAKVTGGSAQDVYGGRSQSGDTDGNSVEISDGTARTIYGGYSSGTGKATNNTVTLTGGTLSSDIYGGVAASGDAVKNTVNIKGGSAAGHDVYGGFSTSGDATGNTVTITGGSVRNVDGGRSLNGHATNNIVNIGSADAAFGGSITGIINGGSGMGFGKDFRTGNKLNVYGNATASNIRNFAEINFHFNSHVNQSASFLNLSDGGGTTIESLSDLNVDGEHGHKGVLLQNTPGSITITDGQNRRIKTSDDKELILEKSTDNQRITYEGYQFANATESTTITESGLTSTWGGRSVVGNSTRHNKITVGSGTHDNIYGGWTAGTGTTATDKDNSYKNEVTLDGNGATTDNLYGGYVDTDAGKAEENTVTIKNGTVNTAVYGGVANKVAGTGHVKKNKVNISGGTVSNVYGGYSAGSGDVLENEVTATGGTLNGNIHGGQSTTGAATGNIVTLKNVTVSGNVTGGEGAATNNNTVNLNGGANVTGALKGGSQANGTGNTLNIKGKDNRAGQIAGFQKMMFDATGVTQGDTMLRLTDGTAMNGVDKDMLKANGTSAGKVTLLENNAGINFTTAVAGDVLKSETNDTMEKRIGVERNGSRITKLTYEGYQFKGKHTTTSFTESGVTSTWGGRSKAGNTTTENTIVVANGTHTNIYGGWTTGSGSTAAADKQKNSTANKVKVNGSANVTGTVYGGFTNVAGGKAQNNEVTIEKNLTANVVGGEAKGEASGNTVTVKANAADITGGRSTGAASNNTVNLTNATVNSITGGDGATTNNNTVNLNGGANVTGVLKGGSAASGTGNALNVKGMNSAGSVTGFQKMNFDATGASTNAAMLRTTGATEVNWETLTVKNASASEKPLTLLENANGINISGRTGDAVKSELNADATMETNIDVRQSGSTITAITYEGYTFKGATQATTYGADTWAGRSKAGNTTQDNKLTLGDASKTYANVYGGWTSGAGSEAAADKQKDSITNKVTIKGLATAAGNVIGGLTEAAGGKATGNTVTVEKDLAANIIGGKATGEASGNTVNLANATVSSVTGGEGAATNNNTVNLNGGANVTGALKGGSQASGTGNTLNVKGKDNKAGTISNVQNMNFDAKGLAKGDTMLEATGAGETTVDWANLKASGTAAKPLTLLKNMNGINLAGYTGAAKSETGDTTETNIDVRKTGGKVTEITYEGYQFKGVTQATTDGDTFGGISKAGNSTRENEINVESGIHANVYGGWTTGSGTTAADNGASYKNKVTVNGSANVTGTVYGGFTNVAGGKATANEVTVTGGTVHDVVGGEAKGEASGNTVTVGANANAVTGGRSTGEASNNIVNLANATVNSITGGEGAATNENTVNLNGGANVTGVLKGGSAANGTGNTLNVNGVNSAGSVTGFQKMNFDATGAPADAALLRTTGATDINWETLTVKNAVASEKPLTLLENANGINISGRTGDAARSELNTDATMETNIDVRQSGSKVTAITYEGYTFRGAAKATTYGADTWAGRSKAGNTTQDNKLTLDDASKTYANVYGGWTSGTGTKAAADKQSNSLNNTVDYTAGTVTGTLYGGYAANGEASGNTVNLGAITSAANIYGGFGTATKNNTINLKGARITGTVYGGSDANGTGNTLAVYKPSEVHDFAGVQNLHFYTDEMAANVATPMLKLGTATKDIRGLNIGVARSGAAPKLIKGDKILLMKTAGGALATDAAIQNKVEGMQGVSRRYEYEIKQEATGELTATVTKAGFAEQAKSLVETRAGLAGFVNQGADYLVQDGLAAAEMSVSASDADKGGKNAQRQGASSDGAAYQLWAGAGANSMRAESGSYVDSKGWNLGVGWAREDVQKDGAKVLFSPFVEYGRGTYDSYLDDGTHGSGKVSYIGAGILGKLTQKDGLWLEGSLRAGRSKSDYSANLSGTAASYDGSNTYYGAHLGAGKTFAIKEDSSIDAYARYFWSHQNSMTATLNTGDVYEFGSVNSQRLRLGLRYSLKDKTTGEFYAGLAWEHEFAGKAGATYQGDAAPSPSLKGSSTMLELGYRFMPKNSRMSYDLHLNGWQGKRKGITGGASLKWAF